LLLKTLVAVYDGAGMLYVSWEICPATTIGLEPMPWSLER
jgi:hypothetical protein